MSYIVVPYSPRPMFLLPAMASCIWLKDKEPVIEAYITKMKLPVCAESKKFASQARVHIAWRLLNEDNISGVIKEEVLNILRRQIAS